MEISPPSNMQQQGGVKLDANGNFQMDNVSDEMKAILEDIQKKKAAASARAPSTPALPSAGMQHGHAPPPPPPGPPPPEGGEITSPEMQRLTTQKEAEMRHRSASETMDTLLLMGEKDNEINSLREKLQVHRPAFPSPPSPTIPPSPRTTPPSPRHAPRCSPPWAGCSVTVP